RIATTRRCEAPFDLNGRVLDVAQIAQTVQKSVHIRGVDLARSLVQVPDVRHLRHRLIPRQPARARWYCESGARQPDSRRVAKKRPPTGATHTSLNWPAY